MEQVLMEVGKVIGSYPFKFQGARILSGVEEGAYGWIAINYLLSSFIKYSYEGKWLHPKNGKILGALNMGGASTQITFTPEGRIADKQTEASFRLYGYADDPDIGWMLGYTLNLTNLIPTETPVR